MENISVCDNTDVTHSELIQNMDLKMNSVKKREI